MVDNTLEHRLSQMGAKNDSTMYSAELRALEMALQIVSKLQHNEHTQRGFTTFSDSQAALQALVRPLMPSGQV